jgi:hypothetical protein
MTDNEMLEQLFRPMKEMKVADNGFTERVMKQLPRRDVWQISRLWTAFCIAIAVVLFVLLRGWELIAYGLLMMMNNIDVAKSNLLIVTVLAGVLGLVFLSDVVRRERFSVL